MMNYGLHFGLDINTIQKDNDYSKDDKFKHCEDLKKNIL